MTLFDRILSAGSAALAALRPPAPAVTPAGDRERRVATPGPYWDRDPWMPGNDVTPQRLTMILAERNNGYLQAWTDLLDSWIEKDPHLFSQLSIRSESVVETSWRVVPGAGPNQQAARRAAAACEELLTHWQGRDPEQNWARWVGEWTWAPYYGRSVHEAMWSRDGRVVMPESLELIDTRRVSLACDAGDPEPRALRIWDEGLGDDARFNGTYGTPLSRFHPDKFLACTPRVRGAQPTREGLGSVVTWTELFRTWSWRELMSLAEMVSRPPVIATYAAGGAKLDGGRAEMSGGRYADAKEIDAARKTVFAPTGALRAVLPDTVRVEALKYSLPTTEPVPLLISGACDALVSKAVNGVANLSDLKAGARAAVEAQERITGTFWRSDCHRVEALVSHLFARFVRANPDVLRDAPAPRLVAETDSAPDRKAIADGIAAAQGAGVAVPKVWAYEVLAIPQPQKGRAGQPDEETLKAPAKATPVAPAPDEKTPPADTPPAPKVAASAITLAAAASHSGVIVCLVPPTDVAAALALPGGEPARDLHVTLAFLGDDADLTDAQRTMLPLAVRAFAAHTSPIAGTFNGAARFASPDGLDAAVLTLDAPALSCARERLVGVLAALGFEVSDAHGFVPHLTRAYVERINPTPGGDAIDPTPVTFAAIDVWRGDDRTSYPLGGAAEKGPE